MPEGVSVAGYAKLAVGLRSICGMILDLRPSSLDLRRCLIAQARHGDV